MSKNKLRKKKPEESRVIDLHHIIEKSYMLLVGTTWKYYETLGYVLKSVEKDNLGWDLEASQNKIKLKIEVKGISGKQPNVELSSNEYKAFLGKDKHYRLAIVTCALISPKLHICRYSLEKEGWKITNQDTGVIKIREKLAAQVILRV